MLEPSPSLVVCSCFIAATTLSLAKLSTLALQGRTNGSIFAADIQVLVLIFILQVCLSKFGIVG
jgi:hypothetical protein